MKSKLYAIFDSGPLIHLAEIGALKALKIFAGISVPDEVSNETKRLKIRGLKIEKLDDKHKDIAKVLATSYNLDLGESEAISLCMQRRIKLFLTDDLEARTVAKHYGLEVHGSIGILVKAFTFGIFSKKESIHKLELLRTKSSLFITKDILDWSIKQIKDY